MTKTKKAGPSITKNRRKDIYGQQIISDPVISERRLKNFKPFLHENKYANLQAEKDTERGQILQQQTPQETTTDRLNLLYVAFGLLNTKILYNKL